MADKSEKCWKDVELSDTRCVVCKEKVPNIIAESKEGRCISCEMQVDKHGEQVLTKINNPNYCQQCFKIKTAIGSRTRNGRPIEDWIYCPKCCRKLRRMDNKNN